MSERMNVRDYFDTPETLRPTELVFGMVREPPAPSYGHQSLVTRLTVVLATHVDEQQLGIVCVAPIDVVLDEDAALVVQPDVVFVSAERAAIVRDRIWGAPDLVVEALSPRTAHRDRTTKLGWYRRYGVKECWLVNPTSRSIEIAYLAGGRRKTFARRQMLVSRVLPELDIPVSRLFE